MKSNPYEEYKTLVNWLIHQHNRRNHHTITFLTINLIIIALIKFFENKNNIKPWCVRTDIDIYFFVLVIIGLIISIFWLSISFRITKEEELRFAQAREMESIFRSSIGGIFGTGYKLFIESKVIGYTNADSTIKPPVFLGKIKVKKVLFIFNMFFIGLYLFLAVCKIYKICIE